MMMFTEKREEGKGEGARFPEFGNKKRAHKCLINARRRGRGQHTSPVPASCRNGNTPIKLLYVAHSRRSACHIAPSFDAATLRGFEFPGAACAD